MRITGQRLEAELNIWGNDTNPRHAGRHHRTRIKERQQGLRRVRLQNAHLVVEGERPLAWHPSATAALELRVEIDVGDVLITLDEAVRDPGHHLTLRFGHRVDELQRRIGRLVVGTPIASHKRRVGIDQLIRGSGVVPEWEPRQPRHVPRIEGSHLHVAHLIGGKDETITLRRGIGVQCDEERLLTQRVEIHHHNPTTPGLRPLFDARISDEHWFAAAVPKLQNTGPERRPVVKYEPESILIKVEVILNHNRRFRPCPISG